MKTIDFGNIREFRKKKGMTQQNFWGKVCVRQVTGSCYENNRSTVPDYIKILLHLVYVENQDIGQVRQIIQAKTGIEFGDTQCR